MCGIFGLVLGKSSTLTHQDVAKITSALFSLSESRGSEAAGLSISSGGEIDYFKRAMRATQMINTDEYKKYFQTSLDRWKHESGLALIGHSRLVTNGTQGMEENNQPVATKRCVGVHNGIVVNDSLLWKNHPDLSRKYEVDTEVIYCLIDKFRDEGASWSGAVIRTYAEIQGEANIAFLQNGEPLFCLATNVGSLYFASVDQTDAFVFASEKHFINEILSLSPFRPWTTGNKNLVHQLHAGHGITVNTDTLSLSPFSLSEKPSECSPSAAAKMISNRSPMRTELRRCTMCILPHTFPFIAFDADGVCNFCREPLPARTDNRETLNEKIAHYRKKNGEPDCIVALSGGRDSCYGLHYIKKELGLNPIAYTYDWAMVTDEARRNSARVCGELGVEHIIRSADILSKRRNIRLNIEAWLRRPELGMIPLFMAGDKQFFHYASQVSNQTGVPLVFFCGGNNLEVTRFKTGFCGVSDQSTNTMVGLDTTGKIKLLAYYAKNYLLNPAYLNRSIFDTLFAFYSTYVGRQDFTYLYRYIDWDEHVIAETLSKYYGWESAADSTSTWRIGDGTAAFYNYIYHTVAGFSEHDTFRSNQIRAGLISREDALSFVAMENQPRYAAMKDYAQLVGFSLDEALITINHIPKFW